MIGELYPGEFEAMEHNGRMDALEQEPCEEELDFVQEHKKISCNLIVEPCEDTISRSDMLDAIGHGTTYTSEGLQRIIKGMPPVNPQPKTGHWINVNEGKWNTIPAYKCSVCGANVALRDWSGESPFCPWCGARMIEPQESEDKE